METDKSLRKRIETVNDLRSIVRTMKALAAVSSRHYDGILKSLENYAHTVELGLQVSLRDRFIAGKAEKEPPAQLAAVVFGSDVGLCGRFNEELVNHAMDKMNGFQVPMNARRVLAVGARIDTCFGEHGHPVEETFITPGSPTGITATIRQILLKLQEWQDHSIKQVLLFYSHAGEPRLLHLLPVDLRQFSRLLKQPWPSRALPTHSMEADRLLAALIRQHLFVSLFRACVESMASEHQMRLLAMQAAEKNIQECLEDLVFEFQNQRQEAIDTELHDIGAGFEAVTHEIKGF